MHKLLNRILLYSVGFCAAHHSYGMVNARLETLIQIDNKKTNDATSISHMGNLSYIGAGRSSSFFLDYHVSESFNDKENLKSNHNTVKQVYSRMSFNNSEIDIGRFYRFDGLGYYTLDGINYWSNIEPINGKEIKLNVYAGKPSVEEFGAARIDSAEYLYGVDIYQDINTDSFKNRKKYHNYILNYPAQFNYRLGFQKYKDKVESNYLNSGFGYKAPVNIGVLSHMQLDAAGRYETTTETKEDLSLNLRLFIKDLDRYRDITPKNNLEARRVKTTGYVNMSYDYYQPVENNPSFRDLFYSNYSFGEQVVSEVSYANVASSRLDWFVGIKQTNKINNGHSQQGHGYRASVNFDLASSADISIELDTLTLGEDYVESIWLSTTIASTYKFRSIFDIALQNERKALYEYNRRRGGRISLQYMIVKSLTISTSAEYLWNSTREDNYLANFSLVYRFSGL